jgi:hypothetical protein
VGHSQAPESKPIRELSGSNLMPWWLILGKTPTSQKDKRQLCDSDCAFNSLYASGGYMDVLVL